MRARYYDTVRLNNKFLKFRISNWSEIDNTELAFLENRSVFVQWIMFVFDNVGLVENSRKLYQANVRRIIIT